jgi:hypothetical protein
MKNVQAVITFDILDRGAGSWTFWKGIFTLRIGRVRTGIIGTGKY